MGYDIDLIERQPQIKKWVYPIRHQVFEVEQGYPPEDGLVFCEFDAVSNHYILLCNRDPVGVVSVADITGLNFVLENYGVDKGLKVAKPHKLAIERDFRRKVNLKMLLEPLRRELEEFEFITVHVTQPSNDPNFSHHLEMARKYERYFGLEPMGRGQLVSGAKTLYLGRDLRN